MINKYIKYGTDKIETKIPVGILIKKSTPITNMSATKIKIAEIIELAGNKILLSVPTIFLAICGPIKPKKKKLPPNATEAEDIATAQNEIIINLF